MNKFHGDRPMVRATLEAISRLERIFPSPSSASDEEFETSMLVDELGDVLAAGLTKGGIGTAALLDAREIASRLRRVSDLSPAQETAVVAMCEVLERWG